MNIFQVWKWFLQAMFPAKCLICRREGEFLCQKHYKFKPAPPSRVIFKYVDEIYSAVAYDDLVCQKLVECFKVRGISDLAEIMAIEIVYRNKKFLENSILVPVPLHWTRKLWRVFNQSEILAKKIAEKVSSAQVINFLQRVEKTEQQARLSKKDRIKNTENAFELIKNPAKFHDKQIILIDDVVASGATLDSAARILKIAGFKNIKAAVFARGGR